MINQQDPMIAAVIGYRLAHGEWPTRLRAPGGGQRSELHDAIAARVEMVQSHSASWIGEGDGARQYKFDENELVSCSHRACGLLERWLATWKEGGPVVVPSRWLERELGAPLVHSGLFKPTLSRLARRHITTVGDLAKRSRSDLARLAGLGRPALIQVAAVLYDRGLAFAMDFESTPTGVVVTQPGAEPDAVFPRRDFNVVNQRSVLPMKRGERLSVRDALGKERAALGDAALAVRPPLPGAAELERMLHDSLAHQARRGHMTAAQLVDYAVCRVAAYDAMTRGGASSWIAEVKDALVGLPLYEREAGAHAYGIGRPPCETYAEIANRSGASESSTHQLVRAFEARVRTMRPALPVCRATISVLGGFGKPVLIEEWWRALPEAIRPPEPDDLATLAALDAWGWVHPIAVYYGAGTYIVGTDHDETRRMAVWADSTIDSLHEWGAARVGRLAQTIGITDEQAGAALERDGRWAAAVDGWFISTSGRGGVIGERVRNMLRRGRPALPGLRRVLGGLRTNRQKLHGAEYPPLDVLRAVLVRSGFDDVTAKAS